LTKVVETIIAEDRGASLRKPIAELEAENSQQKATAVESIETIVMLQCSVDAGIEDYNLLVEGNNSLLDKRDELHCHYDDLKTELVKVCSSPKESVADLEATIRSTETHSVHVAAAGEKCLRDFQIGLVKNLVELQALYVRNTQSIRGLCSPILEGEPSDGDYLHWLSSELNDLAVMFSGVNENFIFPAIESALVIVGDSVDLGALQTAAADIGADILPTEWDV
jgi:hypothetical protein